MPRCIGDRLRSAAAIAVLAASLGAGCSSQDQRGGPVPPGGGAASTTSLAGPSSSTSTAPTTSPGGRSGCVAPVTGWPMPQRLAQLVMVGGQFSALAASAPEAAAGAGAFVLFGQPPSGSGPSIALGIAGLVAQARAHGAVAPWMATDEEGGPVARLAGVAGSLPSARTMASGWTTSQATAAVASVGAAMKALGVTMDLAPVLDVAAPTDTVADEADRSFSAAPSTVSLYGAAFVAGLRAAGVVPVVKHFPGLGHASADTDLGPALDPPLGQLGADLLPFQASIAGGITAVMVGHATVPGLSGALPASLSSATYRYLRQDLGFGGVALTDSLGAGAVSAAGFPEPAAAAAAVEAGADMVMIDATAWAATLAALETAVASGALAAGQVDADVGRILAAKGVAVCT